MQYIAATCSFNPYLDLANNIKLFCDTTSSQHSFVRTAGISGGRRRKWSSKVRGLQWDCGSEWWNIGKKACVDGFPPWGIEAWTLRFVQELQATNNGPCLHMHTWNVPSSGFAWFPVHMGTWFERMRRHEDNVPGRDSCDKDSAILTRLVIDAALLSICTKTPIWDLDQFHGWIWSKSTIQNTIHGWIPSSTRPMVWWEMWFWKSKDDEMPSFYNMSHWSSNSLWYDIPLHTHDSLYTLDHIFYADFNGSKWYKNLPWSCSSTNPVPCFCQVVKERDLQVVGILKTWWNWRNEATEGFRW